MIKQVLLSRLMGIAGSLLATYGGRLLGLYGENSAAGLSHPYWVL
jgi:hypothetical protein